MYQEKNNNNNISEKNRQNNGPVFCKLSMPVDLFSQDNDSLVSFFANIRWSVWVNFNYASLCLLEDARQMSKLTQKQGLSI